MFRKLTKRRQMLKVVNEEESQRGTPPPKGEVSTLRQQKREVSTRAKQREVPQQSAAGLVNTVRAQCRVRANSKSGST